MQSYCRRIIARRHLELPSSVVANGLDSPVELVAKRLGEELLNRNFESGGERDSEARINVVLEFG